LPSDASPCRPSCPPNEGQHLLGRSDLLQARLRSAKKCIPRMAGPERSRPLIIIASCPIVIFVSTHFSSFPPPPVFSEAYVFWIGTAMRGATRRPRPPKLFFALHPRRIPPPLTFLEMGNSFFIIRPPSCYTLFVSATLSRVLGPGQPHHTNRSRFAQTHDLDRLRSILFFATRVTKLMSFFYPQTSLSPLPAPNAFGCRLFLTRRLSSPSPCRASKSRLARIFITSEHVK